MSYNKIISEIKNKKIPNTLIICGNEFYYIDKAIDTLVNTYLEKDFIDLNVTKYDDIIEEEFKSLYENAMNYPFMAEKKIIIINDCKIMSSKKNSDKEQENVDFDEKDEETSKSLEKKILDLIEKVNGGSTILVFVFKTFKLDSRKKIAKEIKKNNGLYELNRLSSQELVQYVVEKFRSKKIIISPANATYFTSNCGYLEKDATVNLWDINSEVNKLASCAYGEKEISREIIDNLMIKSVDSSIFRLLDSIFDKKYNQAYIILQDLYKSGVTDQLVIAMITRQYKLIIDYKYLYESGCSAGEIMQKLKIQDFVAQKLSKISRNTTMRQLEENFSEVLDVDRRIKSGMLNKNVAIEIICNR